MCRLHPFFIWFTPPLCKLVLQIAVAADASHGASPQSAQQLAADAALLSVLVDIVREPRAHFLGREHLANVVVRMQREGDYLCEGNRRVICF